MDLRSGVKVLLSAQSVMIRPSNTFRKERDGPQSDLPTQQRFAAIRTIRSFRRPDVGAAAYSHQTTLSNQRCGLSALLSWIGSGRIHEHRTDNPEVAQELEPVSVLPLL